MIWAILYLLGVPLWLGRVISDVLVINRGLVLQRTLIHRVLGVGELPFTTRPKRVANRVGRVLELDDGTRLEIALGPDDALRLDSLRGHRLVRLAAASELSGQPTAN